MNTSPTIVDVFRFLDGLRKSGTTNMFGAAPYVAEEFDISIKEARAHVSKWMETFDPILTAERRAARAEA